MDYLIQEARREIRRDEQNALLKKCLPYAGAATLLACAIVVTALWSNLYYTSSQENLSSRYHSALSDWERKGVSEGSEELAELAKTPDPTFSYVASIAYANVSGKEPLEKETDKIKGSALSDFLRTVNGVDYPVELRKFESLIAAYERLGAAHTPQEAEKLAQDIDEELKKQSSHIWGYSLRELKGYALISAGDAAAAQSVFSALSIEQNVPPRLKKRAAEVAAIIGEDELSAIK